MSEPVDPLDDLRDSDPAAPDRLSSASLARVRARTQQEIASAQPRERPSARARPTHWAGAAALIVALAVFGVALQPRPTSGPPATSGPGATIAVGPSQPTVSPLPSAPGTATPKPSSVVPGMASCVESYSLSTLAHRTLAFDGTVTSIAGDEVTFAVHRAFAGVSGTTITLTAMGMTGTTISSAGGPSLNVGDRYLVAGDDHFVWGCGFTQPYDAAVADQWAQAFRP